MFYRNGMIMKGLIVMWFCAVAVCGSSLEAADKQDDLRMKAPAETEKIEAPAMARVPVARSITPLAK